MILAACADGGAAAAARLAADLEWQYLSNASCLVRPRLFYACFVVSTIIIIVCKIIRHF